MTSMFVGTLPSVHTRSCSHSPRFVLHDTGPMLPPWACTATCPRITLTHTENIIFAGGLGMTWYTPPSLPPATKRNMRPPPGPGTSVGTIWLCTGAPALLECMNQLAEAAGAGVGWPFCQNTFEPFGPIVSKLAFCA